MADYKSSVPIRTQNNGDAVIKVVDSAGVNTVAVDASGNFTVKITDGTNPLTVGTSGEISVNLITDSVGLAHDHILATDFGAVRLTDGTTFYDGRARSWNLSKVTDNVEVTPQTGAIFDVNLTSGSGTEVHDFNEGVDVAVSGTSTHTYTVPALKTLTLKKIWCSASGRIKMEVKTGPSGSETTKFVGFSEGDNAIDMLLGRSLSVPAGENVLIIRTNRDESAQSIYSTIEGDLN